MAAKKKATKGPDWNAIKAEYLRGGTSYRKLAEKHGVSFNTLKDRAKRESWADQEQQIQHKVATELPDRVAEDILSEAAQATLNHRRLWGLILEEAEKRLSQKDPVLNPFTGEPIQDLLGNPLLEQHVKDVKHLKALAEVFKLGTEGERLALGMVDPNKAKEAGGGANAGGMPAAPDDAAGGIRDAMRRLRG